MLEGVMLEGLAVTLVGMLSVFSFLCILVLAIIAVSKLIGLTDKICPMAQEATKAPTSSDTEAQIAVAIAAIKAKF